MRGMLGSRCGAALLGTLTVCALLCVLTFLVLAVGTQNLTGASDAWEKQRARDFADTAARMVLGDIRSEIYAGSVPRDPSNSETGGFLLPATPAGMVLQPNTEEGPQLMRPNLVKQSLYGRPFFDAGRTFDVVPVYPGATIHPPAARASKKSTRGTGKRGDVSDECWNAPGLLPEAAETPFGRSPDWIYLDASGKTLGWDAVEREAHKQEGSPLCRFAYQIYDTGGLLNLQVAGHDPQTGVGIRAVSARKGSTGFCDLSQIGFTPTAITLLTAYRWGNLSWVGKTAPFGHPTANFLLLPQLNRGFLRCAGSGPDARCRAFTSRREMLAFLRWVETESGSAGLARTVSQYLTHHGLSLEQPSFRPRWMEPLTSGDWRWSPSPSIVPPSGQREDCLYPMEIVSPKLLPLSDFRRRVGPHEMPLGNNRGGNDAWGTLAQRTNSGTDARRLQDIINPAFLEVRIPADGSFSFVRLDGSRALPGEALVKTRFSLRRLGWLTYRGPAAGLEASDPLYDAEGTPESIFKAFGLRWMRDPDSGAFLWVYHHGRAGGIYRLEELVENDPASGRPREADFFELLKAAIGVGSLGKAALLSHHTGQSWDPATYAQIRDRSSVFQLLEIGANLIDQYDADSFPTRIRLANPGASASQSGVDPAYFTASGIEDIPYLYRFHWRPIRNRVHPMRYPGSTPELPAEITEEISRYRGDQFEPGTTSLLGFPELWNPHRVLAADAAKRGAVPREFRIVAANETPKDRLDPLLGEGVRLGPVPALDAENRVWSTLINNEENAFVIRPYGFFAYHSSLSSQTLTWLDGLPLRSDATAGYNTTTQAMDWPADNIPSASLSGSASARSASLYWNRAPILPSSIPNPADGQRLAQLYLGVWSIWKLGFGAGGGLDFQQPPPGWPVSSGYRSSPISRLKKSLMRYPALLDFPDAGRARRDLFYYAQNTRKTYRWTGKAYAEMRYPLGLDPERTFGGNGFAEGMGALRFADGTPLPYPVPAYQKYFFALSDQSGKRRVLFQTNPSLRSAPGTPPWNPGDVSKNRLIDVRGSELTFVLGSPGLFREPTTLCHPGFPEGSLLQCGRDNFLSDPPHNGSVEGPDGVRWVGFSLGEIPSSFLAVTKLYKRDRVATYANGRDASEGFSWNLDDADPAEDVAADALGRIADSVANGRKHPVRVFRIPVNVVGLDTTYLRVQLQYRDALSDRWATYQERFFAVEGMSSGRWSAAPVGVGEMRVADPLHPQDVNGSVLWEDNQRLVGWSAPFVTSYDPRCVRFGNPMRPGYPGVQSVDGSSARDRLLGNPSGANPHAVYPEGKGPTDQPGTALIDLPAEGVPAKTVTASWPVPGGWFHWFNEGYNHGSRYADAFRYASGQMGHAVWKPQWWASAVHDTRRVLQAPTADSGDFGWHPRLRVPIPAGATRTFKAASPEPSVPNFFQNPFGSNIADTLRPGAFSENNAPERRSPYAQAYADPDDVIRRASGAFARVGNSTQLPHGFPLAQPSAHTPFTAANRPIVLNRPFQSVAEMGYAFRGTPWKELNFSTPESADAALLDVFTVCGEESTAEGVLPMAVGKINLNTRQEPVLRSLLHGALKNAETPSREDSVLDTREAAQIARLLVERTTSLQASKGPLRNSAELVGKLVGQNRADCESDPAIYTSRIRRSACEPERNPDFPRGASELAWHFSGLTQDLALRAAQEPSYRNLRTLGSAVRALSDVGQTRVWNLMVDLILQTLPGVQAGGVSPRREHPTAEVRVWVHVSVDRFTGAILDLQWEWVEE